MVVTKGWQPTCWSRANTKPSRIDGILACTDVISLIHDSTIDKQDQISGHAFVAVKLSRSGAEEKRSFARTLPPFKTKFETKLD